jgi:hypothetical protein
VLRSWRKRLSWKFGYRHSKAGRAFDCPWWAIEETYQVAYLLGKLRGVKAPPGMEDRAPYIRPLEIQASEDPSDYEIENSPYWPPPAPPPWSKLSSEDEADKVRPSRPVAFLVVMACWIFHKNDADPWPSILHGHHNERPLKLDAITGFIYEIKTRRHVQTVRSRELARIQMELMNSKDFGDRARALLGPS